MMMSSPFLTQLVVSCLLAALAQAWVQPLASTRCCRPLAAPAAWMSSGTSLAAKDDEDDDDEEYEYVEYEILTEPEFMGSEWLVGTCMESNLNKIEETWVRLATDKDGKNVAIWGDGAQGTWSLDVANQFLSMSKENILGKNIWAGVVEDYYYTAGTVRGWSFFSPASVRGQWQAKRLGVDPEEAGTPPWFEEEEEEEDEEQTKVEAESEEAEAKEETKKLEAKTEKKKEEKVTAGVSDEASTSKTD